MARVKAALSITGMVLLLGAYAMQPGQAQVYDPQMPSLNGSGNSTPAPAKPKTATTPTPSKTTTPAKTTPTTPAPSAAKAPTPAKTPAPKAAVATAPAPAPNPLSAVFSTQPIGAVPAPAPAPAPTPAPAPLPGVSPAASLPGVGPAPGKTGPRPAASARAVADPEFTAASVRASRPLQPGKGVSSRGSRFNVVNYTLKDFIEYAWTVHSRQIEGGPPWIDKEIFDLAALLPSPRPTREQMPRMTQRVVIKNFSLKLRAEKKEMPVYVLTVAQGGPKMKEKKAENGQLEGSSLGMPFAPHIPAKNVSMARLAALLQHSVLDRPVVDQTGLAGVYDFDLQWQANASQFGGQGAKGTWHGNPKDPDLFTAMQQQLGLKLTPQTLPVEVLIVDSAIKPLR